ncbi:MAG: arsenic resistance N-acetyltransferase ArsN2 [Candidatus Hodarchaeota archaeon]
MTKHHLSNKSGMILKGATEKDLVQIQKLLETNELPYKDIPSKIDSLFLGFVGSQFVGIGGLELHGNYGLLRSLVIEESVRGQGYGILLTNRLIEYAQKKGIHEIYLLTMTAEKFFTKMHFRSIERIATPLAIQKTTEFASLCPDTAVCMVLRIRKANSKGSN